MALLVVAGCDGGLAPTTPMGPAFAGTVTFDVSSWPSPDSVVNLWIFASALYPLDSTKVFSGILTGAILIFPAPDTSNITDVRTPVSSVDYFYRIPAGRYPYVGVIQRLRADFNVRSFRVVGVYPDPADTLLPRTLVVREGEVVRDVNMFVNFSQPPPQPF